MITDPVVAAEVGRRILEASRHLDEAVSVVCDGCPEAETARFKQAVGKVLAELLFEVINPLYQAQPQLIPPGLYIPGLGKGVDS